MQRFFYFVLKQPLLYLIFFTQLANAQQTPDTTYRPPAFPPYFSLTDGTSLHIDEAHHNFHTAAGNYKPFAKVAQLDGYHIKRNTQPFSTNSLNGVNIMVIANAISAENEKTWVLPNHPAFTKEEIAALNTWVRNGGSLFLIADHMPFAGAVAELATTFGFTCFDGFAMDTVKKSVDIFYKVKGSLVNCPQTKGIDSVASFTGQGFKIPPTGVSVITLPRSFKLLLPQEAWKFDAGTKTLPGGGRSQLAMLRYGLGKVVFAGEAAMFTAQFSDGKKVGMNTPAGSQNYLLLLSMLHWLQEE